jgi:S1-C subfamily serine protease
MRMAKFPIPLAVSLVASVLLLASSSGPAPASDASRYATVAQAFAPDVDVDGAYLGVRLTEETEHPEGGARVTHVVEESPAEEAGLQVGDIIVEFNGEVIRGPLALTQRIHALDPGDRVALKAVRDGRTQAMEVELGRRSESVGPAPDVIWQSERWQDWQDDLADRMDDLGERLGHTYSFTIPEGDSYAVPFLFDRGRPKLGVQLVETTRELREHLGGSGDEGVLVSKVLSGTPAARAKIAVGDLILSVDGESVATVDELRDALQDKEGETFTVEVARDGRRVAIQVTIPAPDEDPPTGPRAALEPPRPPAPPAPPAPRAAPPAPANVAPPAPLARPALPEPAPAPPPPVPAGRASATV